MHCMSICLLLLDNEKHFLRNTGREKSRQLEEVKGEGDTWKERKQHRAVWMWLMRSLQGRLCHCKSLSSKKEEKNRVAERVRDWDREWGRKRDMRGKRKKTEQNPSWLTWLHLTHCYEKTGGMRRNDWQKVSKSGRQRKKKRYKAQMNGTAGALGLLLAF